MRAEATGAVSLAPVDRERERVSARGREPPLTGGTYLSSGTGARPSWAELGRLGCFGFFFFPRFSNCFSIYFSLGFQYKFKLIQTCATVQRIFKLSMMQHVMTCNVLAKINN
jgi:hypothetical protein